MANHSESTLEQEFQERLLAAVEEVKRHTRFGLKALLRFGLQALLEDIQAIGAVQAAKRRLRPTNHASLYPLWDQPSEYFLATERAGRMDLSIEAIALDPRWSGLFTHEEIHAAAGTLRGHGFDPVQEAPGARSGTELATAQDTPRFARMGLGAPGDALSLARLTVLVGTTTACDVTAQVASALRSEQRPRASPLVRRHLIECVNCRGLYPDGVAAYEHFDQEALLIWIMLLSAFQATMELEDAQLERFMLNTPEDFEDPDYYEAALGGELQDSILPICSWRAVRLGCHIGRFMSAFTSTFDESGDLWLKWRKGELSGPVSDNVRKLDRRLFTLGLLARNLLLVGYWPSNNGDVLWLPADEDLLSIPGVVQVESTAILDDWKEVLGEPPKDINLLGVLYLAEQAAIAQMQEADGRFVDVTNSQALQEKLDQVLAVSRSNQTALADLRQRQDAVVDQLERMVAYMSSTDRHTCENLLVTEFGGLYDRLDPQVRCLLVGAEQTRRMPGLAAPGFIIQGLAAAFELQMRHSVVSGLFGYLKSRCKKTLMPLDEWNECTELDKGRPVWWPNCKPEKYQLGNLRWLLRHSAPEIGEFFDLCGLSLPDVRDALETVHPRRNEAAHGTMFDIGTAEAIRRDWLQWRERPGGIFGVFFRNE